MRSYLILGMCILFLIQYFVEIQWLQYLLVFVSLIAFFGSVTKASRFPRIAGLIMMAVGITVEWSKGTGIDGISEGLILILPLLTLLTLVPLLSIPLRLGGYFESISVLLHHLLHQPKKLFTGITGTLFLLSPILNLGSVRIIHEFLEDLKFPSAMTAKGYIMGFTTAIMWSPYFASVSLVLHYLNVSFHEYILYGISLGLLSLIVGNLLFVFWVKRHPLALGSPVIGQLDKKIQKQLFKLILFVLILLGLCLGVESITHWSMMVIVCLMSIVIPSIFGLKKSNWRQMHPLLIDYRDRTVPMLNNEIMLFMSAGMLAFAMKGTTAMNGISSILIGFANQSFFLFALAILVFVLVVSYIGIHQIAAVGVLAMQLNPSDLGISNVALALILLLSWSISTALSPFSGLSLMVSRFSGISGIKEGLRVNGQHVLIFSIVSIVIISFIK
ncbi:MAG TPA: hypothetical protein VEV44_10030 [Pseudoneobacillus sp.]|nr:hypothetical protein [Pseudoneobacillus sp.]